MNSTLLRLIAMAFTLLALTACASKDREDDSHKKLSEHLMFHDGHSIAISQQLSDHHVTTFAEDSLGYIWIGTERGLNRYNAYDFHQYFFNEDDSASLSSDHVKSLFVDNRKRLWVGLDNGLCLYKDDGTFHRIPSDRPYSVQQIWQNADNRVFVNMTESLYEYSWKADSLVKVIDNFDPLKGYYNQCFTDRKGNIWSVTTGLVRCYDGKTFTILKEIHTGVRPYLSYLGGFGLLMISSIDGLITIDTNSMAIIHTPQKLSDLGNVFKYAYSENENRHFIYTDKGLFFYNRETGEIIQSTDREFPFDHPVGDISAMFLDSKDNLWIGTPNCGFISQSYRNNRFNSKSTLTKGLSGRKVVSMASFGHNTYFIDSNKNLIQYSDEDKSIDLMETGAYLQPPYPNEYDAKIHFDRDGNLWIIDGGKLLKGTVVNDRLVVNKRFNDIYAAVLCIAEGWDGTIFIGTDNGELFHNNTAYPNFSFIQTFSATG